MCRVCAGYAECVRGVQRESGAGAGREESAEGVCCVSAEREESEGCEWGEGVVRRGCEGCEEGVWGVCRVWRVEGAGV